MRSQKSKALKERWRRFKFLVDEGKISVPVQIEFIQTAIDVKKELARTNLWDYCETLSPDFYKEDRHHLMELTTLLGFLYQKKLKVPEYIIQDGEQVAVADTEIDLDVGTFWRKFMMNLPPQHGKSRTLTNLSSWVFGQDNSERILLASYNDDTSNDFSKYTRDIIKEEKVDPDDWSDIVFSDIFPDTRLKHGSATFKQWALEGQHFNYKGGGIGGSFTSKGGTILIIDDPIKGVEEAMNENALERAWNFVTGTFMSRASAKGGQPIEILNMTRWAKKDPCGQFMEDQTIYYLGDTPFNIDGQEYFFPHLYAFGKWLLVKMEVKDSDDRMLCPELFALERYQELETVMDEVVLRANYHQETIDKRGVLYSNLKTYDPTQPIKFEQIINYTDTADEGDDWLCSICAGVYRGEAYILDVLYTKAGMEVTEDATADMLVNNNVNNAKIESNNGGRGFARNVVRIMQAKHRSNRTTVRWFHQSKNKMARILTSSTFVMNHTYFPADWKQRWPDFYKSITGFLREGKNIHDDAEDALTGIAEMLSRPSYAPQDKPKGW